MAETATAKAEAGQLQKRIDQALEAELAQPRSDAVVGDFDNKHTLRSGQVDPRRQ